MRLPLLVILWLLASQRLTAQVVGPAVELQSPPVGVSPDAVTPVYVAPYPNDMFSQGPPLAAP